MNFAARATYAPGVCNRSRIPSSSSAVPGGMELDLVDAVAVAVVRAQHRRMLVRETAPVARRAGELAAERHELLLDPRRALSAHALDEQPQVEVAQRWRLVRDADCHAADPSAGWSRTGRRRSPA